MSFTFRPRATVDTAKAVRKTRLRGMHCPIGGIIIMHISSAAIIVAFVVSGSATAQQSAPSTIPAPVVAVAAAAPRAGESMLPSNTEILLTLNSEVSSKKMKQGEKFQLSVARDVMLGNYIVIPRGTPATGEITYRTGKGAFGKSAKMEVEMRSVMLNGRAIPVGGKFRQEGQGNTGATVGTAVAAGPFAAFVTGRSAVFEQGREFKAYTSESIPVTLR